MRKFHVTCREEIHKNEYEYFEYDIYADSLADAWQYAKLNFNSVYFVQEVIK